MMQFIKKYLLIYILILGVFAAPIIQAEDALPSNNQQSGPDAALFGGETSNSPESTEPSNPIPDRDRQATQYDPISGDPSDPEIEAELSTEIEKTEVDEKRSQAAAYVKGNQKEGSGVAKAVVGTAAGAVGCSAGQILGNILASLISSAIGSISSTIVDAFSGLWVTEKGQALRNSNAQTAAEVGVTVGVLGFGALVLPSWNSIAYCIVNAMITYVANSTIAWVQGGFEGNPSFVNNPEQFFKQLGDIEASAFLKELAYGTLGLNICEPFRAQIVLTIARNHVGNQQQYGQGGYSTGGYNDGNLRMGYGGCTLDDIQGNLQNFLDGRFTSGGWNSWFQISQVETNNPYAVYFNLQARLNGAVSAKKTLAERELNWGKGFLSFRKCDEKTPKEKQNECPITSPGVVIQGQLEKTLGLAKDRLVLAEKFDQVIAAVVNQLVNTALNKVLEAITE